MELLREQEVEALIISGDIYDRSVPPAEAVELLDTILSKIILELKIPVLAIAGNHDSAERLSFGNKLLTDKGLYIEGNFSGEVKKVTLKDELFYSADLIKDEVLNSADLLRERQHLLGINVIG